MRLKRAAAVLLLALPAACGSGGGGGPTDPPPPTMEPGFEVTVVVYYDENGNGSLDANEAVRLPNVDVEVAGRHARTQAGTGRAVVTGVTSGMASVSIRAGGLPPFFEAGRSASVQIPQPAGTQVALAATLAVGDNRPNVYMAFGDSLSSGEGSSDGTGYRGPLAARLREALNRADVLDRGAEGTSSSEGADRVGRGLRALTPAYTLILYGTNDWNFVDCETKFPCFTIDSLREIVRAAKDADSQPFLATIPPGNPSDPRVPAERNAWVARMNDLIRPMAREEGAVLVDLHAAFIKQGDLTQLFTDHVHPNDRGYALIADEWFKAITGPVAGTSANGFAPLPWLPSSRTRAGSGSHSRH